MYIGIMGTGLVGETLATRLLGLGHSVMMGSRNRDNERLAHWKKQNGERALTGNFEETAVYGDVLFCCTLGMGTLDALESAKGVNLVGKILVDVTNPIDFTSGIPPTLFLSNTDSLGETIQRTYPETRVVKALNTMHASLMVEPSRVPGNHLAFLCGDDPAAKATVAGLIRSFGWDSNNIMDLGDIAGSRAMEQMFPAWMRIWSVLGTDQFNFSICR